MDSVLLFGFAKSTVHIVFNEVVGWTIETLKFPLVSVVRDEKCELQHELAQQRAENSGGHSCGTFGCLDGLAARTTSTRLRDTPDPGDFHCGKCFHALNGHAICKKNKRFLWVSSVNEFSSREVSAFGNSRLTDLPKEKADKLHEQGLFLNGDSACPICFFCTI